MYFVILQRFILYLSMSENIWWVTVQNKIFDVKCVVAQEQSFPNGCALSLVYLEILQFQKLFTAKIL